MALRVFAGICIGILMMVPAGSMAATWTVPGTHETLAQAAKAAGAGDTITLAAGTHVASGIRLAAGVTIRGAGSDPAATVLDAGGQGRILLIEGVADTTVVANLTLTGGLAVGRTGHEQSGGAVFVHGSPAHFRRVVFRGNEAGRNGGALRAVASSPVIEECVFEDNRAPNGGGGAIEASVGSSPVITDSDFLGNTAGWGGAVAVRMGGTASVTRCLMVDNEAAGAKGHGGAVFVDKGALAGLVNSVVSGNRARNGGGLACFPASELNLDRVTAVDNTAQALGGGMLIVDASPWIGASILAFNAGTGIGLSGAATPRVSCTDIYGNSGGDWTPELLAVVDPDANFAVDPAFCSRDPLATDGLRLDASSPLLGGAKNCGIPGARAEPCGATAVPDLPPHAVGVSGVAASPNPFNPRTEISFTLGEAQRVAVVVYDLRGRRVRVLADEAREAGEHVIAWNGRDDSGRNVGSGLYLVQVRGRSTARTLKVTLLG